MQRALEDLLLEVDSTIRGAVRHKLRVSLRGNDLREQNLDAMDVLQDIRLKLVRRLSENEPGDEGTSIQEWNAYAATVAYRTCADYLRARYPVRTSLKNSLRRILDKSDRFLTWTSGNGELMCGFAGWKNPSFSMDMARILELREDPFRLSPSALPKVSADTMRAADWHTLLEETFNYVGGPLPLDDLIAIVAPVTGMEDVPDAGESEASDEPAELDMLRSHDLTPYASWLTCERLKLYWAAVLKLLVWHRVAYLMNHRDGDLEALSLYGVATLEQIGESLELTASQYEILARELRVAELPAAPAAHRFLLFWSYLPIEDNVIAILLATTRAQVIGYRNKAKERLKRMLAAEL